ncbi:hypothetical protein P9136_30565, partial [Bacillus cereus]|nr:hypothetical protein [Bacillus cereus]
CITPYFFMTFFDLGLDNVDETIFIVTVQKESISFKRNSNYYESYPRMCNSCQCSSIHSTCDYPSISENK